MANANSNIHARPKLHTFLHARTHRQLFGLHPSRRIAELAMTKTAARTLLTDFALVSVSCTPQESCHVE